MEERGVGDSALLHSHGDFPFPSAPPPRSPGTPQALRRPAIAPLTVHSRDDGRTSGDDLGILFFALSF